jgi:hypothetical protein
MKLKFLTEDQQLVTICQKYWQVNESGFAQKVAEIAEEHSISTYDLSGVVKSNVVAYSSDIVCSECGTPYVYTSRTAYTSRLQQSEWLCENCTYSRKIRQEEARAEQQRIKEEQTKMLLESAQEKYNGRSILLEDLDVKDAVYLQALLRHSMTEDLNHIEEIDSNKTDRLGYDSEHSREICIHLYSVLTAA